MIRIEDLHINQVIYAYGDTGQVSVINKDGVEVEYGRLTGFIPLKDISLTPPKKKVKTELNCYTYLTEDGTRRICMDQWKAPDRAVPAVLIFEDFEEV